MNSSDIPLEQVHFDCRFFRRDIPCKPNKIKGEMCPTCSEYSPVDKRILIIKLGALGDVIRSTPLVVKYRSLYPNCHISWITLSPDILPHDGSIDAIYKMDSMNIYKIIHQEFDIAINLDKDIEACALLSDVKATEKHGFIWENGKIGVTNEAAKHKLITGLFDQVSRANTKSYLQEIFEICGLEFGYEPYLMNVHPELVQQHSSLRNAANGKKIIGLNTGCGRRWPTRLWSPENWIALIGKLQKAGYFPVVLGGNDEDELNRVYERETGCLYPGTFPLPEFIAIAANCDTIVSAVSMMMHLAVGLQKPLVLFNNIFNRHEFEMYGRGEIIEPTSGCECYYGNSCKRDVPCMTSISVEAVFDAIVRVTE